MSRKENDFMFVSGYLEAHRSVWKYGKNDFEHFFMCSDPLEVFKQIALGAPFCIYSCMRGELYVCEK